MNLVESYNSCLIGAPGKIIDGVSGRGEVYLFFPFIPIVTTQQQTQLNNKDLTMLLKEQPFIRPFHSSSPSFSFEKTNLQQIILLESNCSSSLSRAQIHSKIFQKLTVIYHELNISMI